ncbi:uncharacterized protein LOC108221844 [Daucus carota subsp. sativus]|uniref:Uncharacterized protein n=1 Tax=Daucus carota subsp. sativus TaxID=79200 RepID=A0A164ZRM2_DAUCS|nr:PREDICTED: uncharacterized protein LOC108221844 [Daucus carota subsp. sativus]
MGFTLAQLASALLQGSRWKNAAQRKSLINQAKCSLIANMSRRKANIRIWRSDVAQLLRIGLHEEAWSKVERICKEQFMVSAYAQLYQFCDCVYLNYDPMSSCSSELSDDVHEAVSSLIYAASRCGDVPELHSMRNMFKKHLGQGFERNCVELGPGNNVYPQIKQYLSRKLVVPEDVKHQLMNDVVNEENIACLRISFKSGQDIVPESQRARYSKTNRRQQGATFRNELESEDISVTKNRGWQSSSEIVAETQKKASDRKPSFSHVHPKLPDYDDLVVKFTDMKKKSAQKYSNRNMIERLIARHY